MRVVFWNILAGAGKRLEAISTAWYSPNGRNGFRLDKAFLNRALLPRLRGASYCWPGAKRAGPSDHAALLLDLADTQASS